MRSNAVFGLSGWCHMLRLEWEYALPAFLRYVLILCCRSSQAIVNLLFLRTGVDRSRKQIVSQMFLLTQSIFDALTRYLHHFCDRLKEESKWSQSYYAYLCGGKRIKRNK